MKNVIHAYGVLASPLQLSAALAGLNVSHYIVDGDLHAGSTFKNLGYAQPAWPVIVPSIAAFRRYALKQKDQIVFVCCSLPELQETNVRVIRDWETHLRRALVYALTKKYPKDWELKIKSQTVEDYVNVATKESFLNHVQAEIYRLTPYDLRKTVQAHIVSYLAGESKWRPLHQKLSSSYKLDRLKTLMSDPQCGVLRAAIAEYRKTTLEEMVAKQFGVEPFDILYVVNSAKKTAASKKAI